MKQRSLGVMVVLFLFTFGIYPIVWTCLFQRDLKKVTGEGFGPHAHFWISVLTCGIYLLVWQYLAGKRLAKLGAEDRSIIYLILGLVGIGSIINPFLMQHQANNLKVA